MSERGKRTRRSNRTVAYIAAGLVHVAIIGALFVNFTKKSETVEAAYAEKVDVIQATTVDQTEIQKQQDLLKQQDREKQRQKELEEQKLKDLQAQAQKEKDRVADLKKQQELEQQKADQLEEERKALALKRKKEEEQREKELAEQKKQDAEAAAKKKQLAEAEKRREELARQQREKEAAELQRQLQESLAAEEAFLAEQVSKERTTTLVQKHMAMIEQKVKAALRVDPGIERWRESVVNIKVSSSGEVRSVVTIESSGNASFDRTAETAVFKASPLPIPNEATDPDVHRQFWDFELVVKALD